MRLLEAWADEQVEDAGGKRLPWIWDTKYEDSEYKITTHGTTWTYYWKCMGKGSWGRIIVGKIMLGIQERSHVSGFLLETDLIWNIYSNLWHSPFFFSQSEITP